MGEGIVNQVDRTERVLNPDSGLPPVDYPESEILLSESEDGASSSSIIKRKSPTHSPQSRNWGIEYNSGSIDKSLKGLEAPCFYFNKSSHPQGCTSNSCKYWHFCAVCRSRNHGFSTCPMKKFCGNFFRRDCRRGSECNRRHGCLLCHEHHGNRGECALYAERLAKGDDPDEYCLVYNSEGYCDEKECVKRHLCLFCKHAHGSSLCFHSLNVLLDTYHGKRR
jgi:hypothetical protein